MAIMENNNFDKFLRDSVEEGVFPMQEAHWQKVVQLLDEEQNKPTPFLFWKKWGLLALLLLAGVGSLLFSQLGQDNKSLARAKAKITASNNSGNITTTNAHNVDAKKIKVINQEPIVTNNNTEINKTELNNKINNSAPPIIAIPIATPVSTEAYKAAGNKERKGKSNHALRKPKIYWNNNRKQPITAVHEVSITQYNNSTTAPIKLKDVSTNTAKINTVDEPLKKVPKSKKKSKNAKTITNNNIIEATQETVLHNKEAISENNIEVKKPNMEPKTVKQQTRKQINIVKSKPTQKTTVPPIPKKEIAPAFIEETTSAEDRNIAQINNKRIANNEALITTKANGEAVRGARIKRDETIYNPRYNPHAKPHSKNENKELVTKDSIPAIAATATPSPIPLLIPKNNYDKAIWWHLQAGLYGNKGFKGNTSDSIAIGFAPYIASGIKAILNSKLTISTQIGATYYNALNTLKSQPVDLYSFGRDSSLFTVRHNKLIQLYLPLQLQYQLSNKHALTTGLGISYNINILSKVQEQSKAAITNQLGYTSGFNPLDVFAQIGYAYQINKNMQVALQYTQGLKDATKNAYFNNNLNNKQSRISIGFNYNLKKLSKN